MLITIQEQCVLCFKDFSLYICGVYGINIQDATPFMLSDELALINEPKAIE